MGRDQDRRASRRRAAHEVVDEVAASRVEARVRLVEQPELRTARHQDREGGPPALTRREPSDRHPRETATQAELLDRFLGVGAARAGRARPEPDVVDDVQVVVQRGRVAEEADASAHRPRIASEIASEDDRLAGRHVRQPGTEPQQGGLAGAVGASDEDDLTRRDVEVDSGERGEAPEQRDRRAKVDDGVHEPCSP